MNRRAALFDMDRTLLRKHTMTLYVRSQFQEGRASWRDVVQSFYWIARYTFGVLDMEQVAQKAASSLRGVRESVFARYCEDWFDRVVKLHISEEGKKAVARHQEQGDLLAIVTSSHPYWVRPLAHFLRIPYVVTSELEVDQDGCFTGRFLEPLCFGMGKVTKSLHLAKRLNFSLSESTFYSDSLTDLPLLEQVKFPVVVNPDPRLRCLAVARGWISQKW
ncbi:HAD family hydrolase [Pajaroellobacter abortibovis]|uniref:Haloacid dehalogenase n=1 Tax=Pajaroellobacter abortibovis TaxID=1882918 RepID=A0A1L6MVB0_9BACT|nr:HAD-IB family hydrolase [Pajaroellobacter abortibovis]APR99436.1 hypothetical protein BCY86_01110 [Pajaroellobacter abortibovis]